MRERQDEIIWVKAPFSLRFSDTEFNGSAWRLVVFADALTPNMFNHKIHIPRL